MAEHFITCIRLGCSSCRSLSTIYISMCICWCSSTTICIVFNNNAGSTIQCGTPFCIYIQFFSDPESISAFITCCIRIGFRINKITIIIVGICHIDRLIIRSCHIGFINRICFSVKDLCTCLIQIPTNKLEASQISTSWFTNMSSFADTECHGLVCSTPVDISGSSFRIIDMQEYTVLFLTPLSVNCNTAFRHYCKCVFLRAGTVNVPSFKDISGRCMPGIRYITVVGGNISTISDP